MTNAAESTYLVRDPLWYNTRTLDDARTSFVRPYGNSYDYAIHYSKLPEPRKVVSLASAEFYLASPAELLFTDARGRRVGTDPATGISYDEIPGARYDAEESYESSEEDINPATQHRIKVLTLPALSDGGHTLRVIGTGEGSYTLTAHTEDSTGSTTQRVFTASTTPGATAAYQLTVSGDTQTVSQDMIPPEAAIAFSTSTRSILIKGVDDVSETAIATTSVSAVISDASGNTLALAISKNAAKQNHAAMTISSFAYSTGTTTNATTTLRYFWGTDRAGTYTHFISAIRTPRGRMLAIYSAWTGKTHMVASAPADDTDDLSARSAILLLRKRVKTYPGLYIPGIVTDKGAVVIR